MKVAGCLHVTKETAVAHPHEFSGGARRCRGPAAILSPLRTTWPLPWPAEGTSIYAWHGLTKDEFYWCIDKTLEMKPT